jgi:hypothetical protein
VGRCLLLAGYRQPRRYLPWNIHSQPVGVCRGEAPGSDDGIRHTYPNCTPDALDAGAVGGGNLAR